MELRLDGKVALVTGGSRGIGKAIGHAYAGAGAKVVLSSRKQAGLDAAASEISAATGSEVIGIAANAGDAAAAAAAVATTVERFGSVDVLVNNAATNPYMGPLMGISVEQADKTDSVNQRAVVTWTQEAWKASMNESGGVVLNIASVGGLSVDRGGIAYYNVTKAAVIHLTRQLAAELAPGVRVLGIAPGLVKTDMARALWEANEELIAKRMPLRRLGEVEDIANLALFLTCDAASWMTGVTVPIDGGALLGGGLG